MGPGFESLKVHQKVSVNIAEGPPVPIPNTEVKLSYADNTRLATVREDRSMPTQRKQVQKCACFHPLKTKYSSLAQSVERMTVNHDVAGSSPARGAKQNPLSKEGGFLFVLFTIHYSSFIIH